LLAKGAVALEKAGADYIFICSVTTNISREYVQKSVKVPIVSIIDALADPIKDKSINTVGLIATKSTMDYPYFIPKMKEQGIKCIVPESSDRKIIHDVIYDELVWNKVYPASKKKYLAIIEKLKLKGAKGIILGCTEIPMLVNQSDIDIPVFDVTELHCKKAIELALEE